MTWGGSTIPTQPMGCCRMRLTKIVAFVTISISITIWHDRWARGNTGRIYYQHQQTPNQTDPINQLHRAHQTAVFRLRTHHAPLNAHLHRIKKEHPAKCVYCPNSDETIEHFLFHCPLYDNIRSRLLPAQPNIHNTLYGSTTQLQRTATYNMSAMNRRDEIVRSLGDQER